MNQQNALLVALNALQAIDDTHPYPIAKHAIVQISKALAQPDQTEYDKAFEKAFNEYAESEEGKARTKMAAKIATEQAISAIIKHGTARQQKHKTEQEKMCVDCGKPTMHMGNKCYGCCQTAQPEQDAGKCACGANLYIDANGKPCSKALAQGEPQVCCGDYEKCMNACTPRGRWLAEKELAKPEQEPVAWMEDSIEFYAKDHPTNSCTIPLYTAPPKREWVGLTDGEIKDILDCGRGGLVDIRKAEQLLKEKNDGV